MKKLPLGIQSFRKIIEGGYVYVDKTQYIYDLINNASHYFLSRPRRFGKSLLLDTISEVLSGSKELFKGLWIYDSDYDFVKYPVIRFDMSRISNETPEILKESILSYLKTRYSSEGFELEDGIASDAFAKLITLLHKKYNQRVVVLIDEYDKPILDHLNNIEIAEVNRQVIRGFYGILKSMDPYLKFTLLTGVSKFTKTSVFSGLNNLKDLTLIEKYSNICGVVTEDLDKYFNEHIENLSGLKKFKHYGNLHAEILSWYDGYSWDGETRVINPFSLLNFLDQGKFANFWYASGTPKFLIDLIKKNPDAYTNLKHIELSEDIFDSADIEKVSIGSLLFQTGYLTIKEILHMQDETVYRLCIPNFEVRRAFNLNIIAALTECGDEQAGQMRREINAALQSGDLQKMLEMLRGLFASIPYQLHINHESYYHSIFFTVMDVLGFDMDVEVSVSKGRIDATLELDDKVYVMEFKYKDCKPDASPDEKQKLFEETLSEGMNQIRDRGYAQKYTGSGKTIYQTAFAFLGRDDIEMEVEVL